MISFESIMSPLSAALGLSVVIERVLEFTKNVLEPLLGSHVGCMIPSDTRANQIIEDLQKTHENDARRLEVEEKAETIKGKLKKNSNPSKKRSLKEDLTALEKDGEWDEHFSQDTILVEPATDPDDGSTLKDFILQVFGFAMGILLARLSGLRLFGTFLADGQAISPWVDYLLTGLLIGGGSRPIHRLIQFIAERKIKPDSRELATEEEDGQLPAFKEEAPAVIVPLSDTISNEWVDIPYQGGVDCEKLEAVHKRKENPNLIVYHHTAMNSQSTFEDVVRVIKDRTDSKGNHWITGYHCVVCATGSVHPFCRWDRYGSHATGYNLRSLGIAFNGNFETDPSVPYSNPNGRLGPTRPSEDQLKAAARVVTLWTFLYSIRVDFKNAIIPHKNISSKTCPGSRFPYEEFEKWIAYYREKWEKSQAVQERIQAFTLKPYLYV